jgi:tRNA/tmRNA/rRNA uracil-C5-methylase (TrmA/RlmC/RlmD family)
MREEGFFRHLILRKTHFTQQMMIILGFNPKYFSDIELLKNETKKLHDFFVTLAQKYSTIKCVYFSYNDNKADVALGKMEHIYGTEYITEKIHDLYFHISPKSFFQTNSSGAEKLYSRVLEYAHKENLKNQTVLDLYG